MKVDDVEDDEVKEEDDDDVENDSVAFSTIGRGTSKWPNECVLANWPWRWQLGRAELWFGTEIGARMSIIWSFATVKGKFNKYRWATRVARAFLRTWFIFAKDIIWRQRPVHCKTNEARQCKTDGWQNKTVRDRRKTRQDRRNKAAQDWDPWLGCIECPGCLCTTSRATAEIPQKGIARERGWSAGPFLAVWCILSTTWRHHLNAQPQLHRHNRLSQASGTNKISGNATERHDLTRHHCYTFHDSNETVNRNRNQPCLKRCTAHILKATTKHVLYVTCGNMLW